MPTSSEQSHLPSLPSLANLSIQPNEVTEFALIRCPNSPFALPSFLKDISQEEGEVALTGYDSLN